MRVSLWSGLIPACRENLRRQQTRVRLFEIGNKFDCAAAARCAKSKRCAGVATGARWPEQWGSAREALDFYDVKGDVQSVLALTGDAPSVRFEADSLPCLRPGAQRQEYSAASTPIGWLGELHPQLVKSLDLSQRFIFI